MCKYPAKGLTSVLYLKNLKDFGAFCGFDLGLLGYLVGFLKRAQKARSVPKKKSESGHPTARLPDVLGPVETFGHKKSLWSVVGDK